MLAQAMVQDLSEALD